jgi:hypothetical protein
MAPEISLRDPNIERAGHYKDTATGEVVSIEGPDLGVYRKVYQDGKKQPQPLGTVVSESDIRGLERID